ALGDREDSGWAHGYCSAKMIASQGVRNDRMAFMSAFWCHPAAFVHRMLFSTRNLARTVISISVASCGEANTHTDAWGASRGLAASRNDPIQRRNSSGLAHCRSQSSFLTLK